MTRRNSSAGYLYAIRVLALDWQANGIHGDQRADGVLDTLTQLAADEGGWRDDSRALLTAAEALVAAADARSAEARNNDGALVCALDFEAAHELLDEEANADG